MTILFSAIAFIISVLAIFINQWVTLIPQLGIAFQYHRRRVQVGIALLALLLAVVALLQQPTPAQIAVLILVIVLTPLSGFFHASKAIVAVDRPRHVSAVTCEWPDTSLVLGYAADDETACAWSLETLIPHHIVNDVLAEIPILAAW